MSMMQVENTFFDLAEACTDRNVLGTIPVLTFAKFLDVKTLSPFLQMDYLRPPSTINVICESSPSHLRPRHHGRIRVHHPRPVE